MTLRTYNTVDGVLIEDERAQGVPCHSKQVVFLHSYHEGQSFEVFYNGNAQGNNAESLYSGEDKGQAVAAFEAAVKIHRATR